MAGNVDLPRASHQGILQIGEIEIPCAVLEDGTRLLTQEGVLESIGRAKKAKGGEGARGDGTPAFLRAANLRAFVPQDLEGTTSPIEFRNVTGQRSSGYLAELLPKVCQVFIDAEDAGQLQHNQQHIAARCRILIRGFAVVGIIALVDEATGYQENRAREALEGILAAFIADELNKWTKTFPDEYYRELCRLKGWPYMDHSRPAVFGHVTNNVVYDRLAPGVKDELRGLNPVAESGRRAHKHHQWLTTDVGHPRLREHLTAIIALMRVSDSWEQFIHLLDRALPRYDEIQDFLFDIFPAADT